MLLFTTDQWLTSGADDVGRVPERALDRAPVFSLHFPVDQSWTRYNGLQQLSLFHHGVHCRADFDRDRPDAESGDLEPARLVRDGR